MRVLEAIGDLLLGAFSLAISLFILFLMVGFVSCSYNVWSGR